MVVISSPQQGTPVALVAFLRESIGRQLPKVVPGLLELLHVFCVSRYGKDPYALFVESPCTFYKALLELYKTESTASILLKLFLRSFVTNPMDVEKLLEYARSCKSEELKSLLLKVIGL